MGSQASPLNFCTFPACSSSLRSSPESTRQTGIETQQFLASARVKQCEDSPHPPCDEGLLPSPAQGQLMPCPSTRAGNMCQSPVLSIYALFPRSLSSPSLLLSFIHAPRCLAGLEWEKTTLLLCLITGLEPELLPERCKAVAMETPNPFFCLFF